MSSLEEVNLFRVEDFSKVFINKYYKKDPNSPKSLFDLPEKERYIKLLLHGAEEDFRKEYGITLDDFVKWYHIREVLADLIDLKKLSIEDYDKLCEENNMGYIIIDNFE